MAGMGLSGGTARCYDWYMDYLKVSYGAEAPGRGSTGGVLRPCRTPTSVPAHTSCPGLPRRAAVHG